MCYGLFRDRRRGIRGAVGSPAGEREKDSGGGENRFQAGEGEKAKGRHTHSTGKRGEADGRF